MRSIKCADNPCVFNSSVLAGAKCQPLGSKTNHKRVRYASCDKAAGFSREYIAAVAEAHDCAPETHVDSSEILETEEVSGPRSVYQPAMVTQINLIVQLPVLRRKEYACERHLHQVACTERYAVKTAVPYSAPRGIDSP